MLSIVRRITFPLCVYMVNYEIKFILYYYKWKKKGTRFDWPNYWMFQHVRKSNKRSIWWSVLIDMLQLFIWSVWLNREYLRLHVTCQMLKQEIVFLAVPTRRNVNYEWVLIMHILLNQELTLLIYVCLGAKYGPVAFYFNRQQMSSVYSNK